MPNPYTFADLKAELRKKLFPHGEAQNLVAAHDSMFAEALVEIGQYIECYQVNHVQQFAQCSTLFRCGYSIIDKPRGHINRLYVIDKINPTTGKEDAESPTDWCSDIEYYNVPFHELDRFVSATLAGSCNAASFGGWFNALAGSIASQFAMPAQWFSKYRYNPPTDAGMQGAPKLPMGMHFGQPSTDADGRAGWGMWAIKGGQIYVAPWIQSTETIILEWDGIKRTWSETDLVDDDPILKKAVENYVRMEHERIYGHDLDQYTLAQQAWILGKQDLEHECVAEQQAQHQDGKASAARSGGQLSPTYVNTEQQATAYCPDGYAGNPVSITIPAGAVQSYVSVDDANNRAKSKALQQAGDQLACTKNPDLFKNTPQSFTAKCPSSATGSDVTRTIAAGTFTSQISQSDANNKAKIQAQKEATAALTCTFFNTEQTYVAKCPAGSSGANVPVTIPAGSYSSTISQKDADTLALNEAKLQANAALVCTGNPPLYYNTAQSVRKSGVCSFEGVSKVLTVTVIVEANRFVSPISQADANNQALTFGNQQANEIWQQKCAIGNFS